MTYKLINKTPEGDEFVIRKSDGAFIPFDEANTNYQQYLKWVAEGNTAEAAD